MINEHQLFTPGKKAGELARRVTHTNISVTHRHGVTVAKYATIDGKTRKTRENEKKTHRHRYVYFCMAGISLCQLRHRYVYFCMTGISLCQLRHRYVYFCMAGISLCQLVNDSFDGGATSSVTDTRLSPPTSFFFKFQTCQRARRPASQQNDVCGVMFRENHFTVSCVLGHVLTRFLHHRVSRCIQREIRLA